MKTALTLFIGSLIGVAAIVGGYYFLTDRQSQKELLTLSFTEAEVQEKLARKFPREEKIKGLVTVVIEEPVVSFLGNDNRIRLATKVSLVVPFVGAEELSATFTSSVRYNQEDHTLRTADYVLERLTTDRLPEKYQKFEPWVREALSVTARKFFNDEIIHTVENEEFNDKLTRMFLQEFKIKKGRLEIVLGL